MAKRLQNRISGSRFALPFTALYGTAVWLTGGLYHMQWWVQFACFVLSVLLMVELNNSNALIRIYSRMVSCSFIVLSVMPTFLMDSIREAACATLMTAAYLPLFHSYQNRAAAGPVFYSFLLTGIASLFYVHILVFIPVIWLMMATNLQSMSRRTLAASLIGTVTPYWFATLYYIYYASPAEALDHFRPLTVMPQLPDYTPMTVGMMLTAAFMAVIAITGTVHYIRTSYNDKIRTRMIYNCFILMTVTAAALLAAFPQHYDMLTRMLAINIAPLAAHFLALTKTRITNIAFCIIVAAAVAITVYNLWISSPLF